MNLPLRLLTTLAAAVCLTQLPTASLGVEIEVLVVNEPSGVDTTGMLSISLSVLNQGTPFFVEVWATNNGPTVAGLACIFVDVTFNPAFIECLDSPAPGGNLPNFASGDCASSGLINDLGGCADVADDQLGAGESWALVGRITMRAIVSIGDDEPAVPFILTTAASGTPGLDISLVGEGKVSNDDVRFGSISSSLAVCLAIPADLDGDSDIEPGEMSGYGTCFLRACTNWAGGGPLPPPPGYVSRAGTLFLRGGFNRVD